MHHIFYLTDVHRPGSPLLYKSSASANDHIPEVSAAQVISLSAVNISSCHRPRHKLDFAILERPS